MHTYIYAITGADHPLPLNGLHGVGDPRPRCAPCVPTGWPPWSATRLPDFGPSDAM